MQSNSGLNWENIISYPSKDIRSLREPKKAVSIDIRGQRYSRWYTKTKVHTCQLSHFKKEKVKQKERTAK